MACSIDNKEIDLKVSCFITQDEEKKCGIQRFFNGAWIPSAAVCELERRARMISFSTSGSQGGSSSSSSPYALSKYPRSDSYATSNDMNWGVLRGVISQNIPNWGYSPSSSSGSSSSN